MPTSRRREEESEDATQEGSLVAQNALSSTKKVGLVDMPRDVLRLIIKHVLGGANEGYIREGQALALVPLAATCRLLREVCACSLTALYVRCGVPCRMPCRLSCRDAENRHEFDLPQRFLTPIFRLARSHLSQLELYCMDQNAHGRWFTNLGVACPQVEDFSLSVSSFSLPRYGGLLAIIGPRLKVLRITMESYFSSGSFWKELTRLCPALEKFLWVTDSGTLRSEDLLVLCEAYGDCLTELGLFFREIAASNVVETIVSCFSKLESLQVEESGTHPKYRASFDCFSAYERARSALGMTCCTGVEDSTPAERKKSSRDTLRFFLAELSILREHDLRVMCMAAGSHLLTVNLSGMQDVTDSLLKMLGEHCKKLRAIDLPHQILVTDRGIESFCRGVGSSLRYLRLGDAAVHPSPFPPLQITNRSLESVVQYCRNITFLDISLFFKLTDEALCNIAQALGEGLRVLRLRTNRNLTCVSARALARHCPNIHLLIVGNARLSSFWSDLHTTMKLRVSTPWTFGRILLSNEWLQPWRTERLGSLADGQGVTFAGNFLREPTRMALCHYLSAQRQHAIIKLLTD